MSPSTNDREHVHDSEKNLQHFIHELKHYVPSQKTLKDFIHHNTLHAFQHKKFFDAIFEASEIFGYKVTLQLHDYRELFRLGRIKEYAIEKAIIKYTGETELKNWTKKVLFQEYDENINSNIGLFRSEWKRVYKVDIDSLVHPKLYRILSSYLDQGIALWEFPELSGGFLNDMRSVIKNSKVSFFLNKDVERMFLNPSTTLYDILTILIGDPQYFKQYVFDMVFSHPGWSGIVSVIEDSPDALLLKRTITLEDLLLFELCLELDTMRSEYGNRLRPLSTTTNNQPLDVLVSFVKKELHIVLTIWQEAFEWSYYDQVLGGIIANAKKPRTENSTQALFQAVFCIDERECSLRRHIEYIEPTCQTYGAPGFFGVEFYFKAMGAKFLDKLCPAPVTPKYLIIESESEIHTIRDIMLSKDSFTLLKGFFMTMILGIVSFWKLLKITLFPDQAPANTVSFSQGGKDSQLSVENLNHDHIEEGLQVGFTIIEMADRIENFLKGIGLTKQYSQIIYMMAHGSSSANNPHSGAYDCGACSGRPGSVNARVFCIMANHPEVRLLLRSRGIDIPQETVFVPCMHDTTSDIIGYYDEVFTTEEQKRLHASVQQSFEQALDLNAKERSRRFASIDTTSSLQSVRKAIEKRAYSLFEPRPELGHGTNSLAIVGRRSMTRGIYLDRRAFLNSYDYSIDLDGTYLQKVMAPIGIVCGGINLEYYFSRVDNQKLGCGTKLPHNVIGLLGIANSVDGDLRPGLSWQMIEPHDPVRLMVIVEHYPNIVLKCIQSSEAMYEWYNNEWVHIAALHPETGEIHYFSNGAFQPYDSSNSEIHVMDDIHDLFEKAPAMMSSHITHATFENLPIYQLLNNKQ